MRIVETVVPAEGTAVLSEIEVGVLAAWAAWPGWVAGWAAVWEAWVGWQAAVCLQPAVA